MLIESSLPGAVASRSRASSRDEGQPPQLPPQPGARPALEVVDHFPPTLADVRIVVRPQTPQPGEASQPGETPQVAREQAAPSTCGSKVKDVCVGGAKVICTVLFSPVAVAFFLVGTAGAVLGDIFCCCKHNLLERFCCDD